MRSPNDEGSMAAVHKRNVNASLLEGSKGGRWATTQSGESKTKAVPACAYRTRDASVAERRQCEAACAPALAGHARALPPRGAAKGCIAPEERRPKARIEQARSLARRITFEITGMTRLAGVCPVD